MKQNLKQIVATEPEKDKSLPVNHRQEFLKKLQQQNKAKTMKFPYLKVAVVIVISLVFGALSLIYWPANNEQSPLLVQLQQVEKDYLNQIDKEWEAFASKTSDERLKRRYEQRLDELHADYTGLTLQFQKEPNNLQILESLIQNLQTRLQLLKDIQKHINLINQQNEHYENSI
jgi:hypothetical protein